MDRLACADILTNDIDDGAGLVLALGYESVHTCLEVCEGFCNSGVENNHCAGAVCLGTYCAELEAIAGEGEW